MPAGVGQRANVRLSDLPVGFEVELVDYANNWDVRQDFAVPVVDADAFLERFFAGSVDDEQRSVRASQVVDAHAFEGVFAGEIPQNHVEPGVGEVDGFFLSMRAPMVVW